MPLSQLVLPSFTLALSDSVTLRDFQRAHSREIQIPLMVRRVRDIHLPATDPLLAHSTQLTYRRLQPKPSSFTNLNTIP